MSEVVIKLDSGSNPIAPNESREVSTVPLDDDITIDTELLGQDRVPWGARDVPLAGTTVRKGECIRITVTNYSKTPQRFQGAFGGHRCDAAKKLN